MIRRILVAALGIATFAGCRHRPVVDVGRPPEGVSVETKIQYYDVPAASVAEIRRAVLRFGPRFEGRVWESVTTSNFEWTFRQQRSIDSCNVTRAKVNVKSVIVFPRWAPSAPPDSAALEWWHQEQAGLVEHEKGHVLIAVRTASEIVRELGATTVACDDLKKVVDEKAQTLIKETKARQAAYDAATRHGATQIQQAGRLKEP